MRLERELGVEDSREDPNRREVRRDHRRCYVDDRKLLVEHLLRSREILEVSEDVAFEGSGASSALMGEERARQEKWDRVIKQRGIMEVR